MSCSFALSLFQGFPGDPDGKEAACSAGGTGSISGSGRSPWRREWLPTPGFLPGESHGQRSLVGYSRGVTKSRTQLTLCQSQLSNTFIFPVRSQTLSFSLWEVVRCGLHAPCLIKHSSINYHHHHHHSLYDYHSNERSTKKLRDWPKVTQVVNYRISLPDLTIS